MLNLICSSTKKVAKSNDKTGSWELYSLTLISKENEKIEVNQLPIKVEKHGKISQIVIDDGTNKTALKDE